MPRPSSSNGAAADANAYEAAVSSAIARLAEEVRMSATVVIAHLQVMGLLPTHCRSAESEPEPPFPAGQHPQRTADLCWRVAWMGTQ